MKVIAVIVTHNRLSLLKECVAATVAQHPAPAEILVINNGSTDQTEQWLHSQAVTTITQPNRGGSAGFNRGTLEAFQRGADWIWIMDDDTIPGPGALQELCSAATAGPGIGFLCSRVLWTDGSPHLMNIPTLHTFQGGQSFNRFQDRGFLLIGACSFVSLFVSRTAVEQCGLPISEFFIWGDDAEFTQRIRKAGFLGGYVPSSTVLHKTPENHQLNIYQDGASNIWKYRYGMRNQLFMTRQAKGLNGLLVQLLKRFFIWPFRILKKRKDHRWLFIRMMWSTAVSGASFNPRIEKVS